MGLLDKAIAIKKNESETDETDVRTDFDADGELTMLHGNDLTAVPDEDEGGEIERIDIVSDDISGVQDEEEVVRDHETVKPEEIADVNIDSMLDLDDFQSTESEKIGSRNKANDASVIDTETRGVGEKGPAADPVISHSIKRPETDYMLPDDKGELSSVLWDASAELLRCVSQQEMFNVLLLLVMGQLGTNSASLLTPLKGEEHKWGIADTRGARLRSKMITFKGTDPIMKAALAGERFVDIERFAGIPECRDEYPLFNSISGRYLLPIAAKNDVLALIVVGEKLSGEEYLPQETSFLLKLVENTGSLLSYMEKIERLSEENRGYIERNTEYSDIEKLERDFRRSFIVENVDRAINEKMAFYGVESYAFFSRSERGDRFLVRFCEKEDLAGFREGGFSAPVTSEFSAHLIQHDDWEEFDHPSSSRVLRSVFDDSHILKMNICVSYPFVIRGYLAGFLVILRAKRERLIESRTHVMRLARTVFSILQQRESVMVDEGIFIDTVSRIDERMERTVRDALALKIPVAFVLFSIKNMKRYIALFGSDDAEKLMESFRDIVQSRLSGTEYALRTDRGRILTVLPGKNKKYAVPFANAVHNELVVRFHERESQIMLSFMIGEYPKDGKGLSDILEYLN
jgi:GGDEF domain-containing protein